MPPHGARRPDEATYHALIASLTRDARSRGGGAAQSRPADAASPEPRRVRQRHPRSAGARRRCRGAAAARRFGVRLRQHRRRARRVAVAAGALSVGGGKDQRAGGRRSATRRRSAETYRVRQDLSQNQHIDGLPLGTRRRAARCATSFPLDGEYEFQIQPPAAPTSATCAASSTRSRSRSTRRRRARAPRDDRRQRRSGGDVREADRTPATRSKRGCASRVPVKAGPHDGRRRVRRATCRSATRGGCSRSCAAPSTRSTGPGCRTSSRSTITGPFNADRPGRHAEPPPDLHAAVPAEPRRRSDGVRARRSSRRWRAARIGSRSTEADLAAAARLLPGRPRAKAAFETGIQRGAAARSWRARSSCSASSAIPPSVRAGRAVSRSATSSWRRGCRSSSGAASRTTSC